MMKKLTIAFSILVSVLTIATAAIAQKSQTPDLKIQLNGEAEQPQTPLPNQPPEPCLACGLG